MIRGLPQYPKQVGAQLAWLQTIPSHWNETRMRTLITKCDKRGGNLPLLSVAREQGVFERAMDGSDGNHNMIPDDVSNYKVAESGNLVINKMKAWQGSMGIAPVDGLVSPAYYVYELGIGSRQFAQYLLRSKNYVAEFGKASDGVRIGQWDLSIPRMREILVLEPPEDEQHKIVAFLDYANWRVDRFVRNKRKLIALLNEQKQAIIHQAVTQGLAPNAPMKPSGLPWLGEIPAHWEILRNMALFEHKVRPGVSNLPVLQVSLRSGVTAESVDQFGRQKRLISDVKKYKLARKGDIAYNTMRMWQGAVGVAPEDGLVSPAYVVLRSRDDNESAFYDLVFHTEGYKQQVNRFSTGIVSDRNRLYWESFKQMPNIYPPPVEQRAIVQYVSRATEEVSAALDIARQQVDFVEEYRTRLISDVVTGKLDVRAVEVPKYDRDGTDDDVQDHEFDEELEEVAT